MFVEMDFKDWYNAVRLEMPEYLLREINPTIGRFYSHNGVYLQVAISPDNLKAICVMLAFGKGFDWMRILRKWAKEQEMEYIFFQTAENNEIVHRLAKYWNAEKFDSEEPLYSNGQSRVQYVIEVQKSSRMNTNS